MRSRMLFVIALIALMVLTPLTLAAGPPTTERPRSNSDARLLRLLARHDDHDPFEVLVDRADATAAIGAFGSPNASEAGAPAFLCDFGSSI